MLKQVWRGSQGVKAVLLQTVQVAGREEVVTLEDVSTSNRV